MFEILQNDVKTSQEKNGVHQGDGVPRPVQNRAAGGHCRPWGPCKDTFIKFTRKVSTIYLNIINLLCNELI